MAGIKPKESDRKNIHIYLIEFTRTSEAYWDESKKAKIEQHKQVVKAIKQSGWQCSLIVIQIGVRGGIPNTTISGMKTLGIATKDIQQLCTKLSEKSSVASVKAWWTRHAQCRSSTHNSPQAWKGRPISRQNTAFPGTTSAAPFDGLTLLHKARARSAALTREALQRKGTD